MAFTLIANPRPIAVVGVAILGLAAVGGPVIDAFGQTQERLIADRYSEPQRGALFFDAPNPAVLPRFASAQCQGGTLVVSEIGKPPRDFMSKLLDHALGPENYHLIEYQIFYLSLRRNAHTRVAAYLAARTGVK